MAKDNIVKITPKRLGKMALADFCVRCFWYLLLLRFHPPFDFPCGAIYKWCEQAQLAFLHWHLKKYRRLPKEFGPFSSATGLVDFPRDWRKFQYQHPSGVLLYGEPDDIWSMPEGNCVIDLKTADGKDGKDPLLPCYEIQTNGYAMISELGLDLGKVVMAGLIYWNGKPIDVIDNPGAFYEDGKLWMPFTPNSPWWN